MKGAKQRSESEANPIRLPQGLGSPLPRSDSPNKASSTSHNPPLLPQRKTKSSKVTNKGLKSTFMLKLPCSSKPTAKQIHMGWQRDGIGHKASARHSPTLPEYPVFQTVPGKRFGKAGARAVSQMNGKGVRIVIHIGIITEAAPHHRHRTFSARWDKKGEAHTS